MSFPSKIRYYFARKLSGGLLRRALRQVLRGAPQSLERDERAPRPKEMLSGM
jgi:hypothetical protein